MCDGMIRRSRGFGEPAPGLTGGGHQLEDHRQRRLVGEASIAANGVMPDGGKTLSMGLAGLPATLQGRSGQPTACSFPRDRRRRWRDSGGSGRRGGGGTKGGEGEPVMKECGPGQGERLHYPVLGEGTEFTLAWGGVIEAGFALPRDADRRSIPFREPLSWALQLGRPEGRRSKPARYPGKEGRGFLPPRAGGTGVNPRAPGAAGPGGRGW